MNMDTSSFAFFGESRGAALSGGYANVAEDGTICFVSDRVYRSCPACDTVFVGSAFRSAFFGPDRCPYCRTAATAPMAQGWLS